MYYKSKLIDKYVLKNNKFGIYKVLSGNRETLQAIEGLFTLWKQNLNQENRERLYSAKDYLTKKDAIEAYCGYSFSQINEFLRQPIEKHCYGNLNYIEKYIPLIDSAIDGQVAPYDMIAVKFLRPEILRYYLNYKMRKKGYVFVDKGFVSTSLNWEISKPYDTLNDVCGLLIIKIKSGTPGCYIEGISRRGESEFLLKRGTIFQVEKILNKSKHFYLCSIINHN